MRFKRSNYQSKRCRLAFLSLILLFIIFFVQIYSDDNQNNDADLTIVKKSLLHILNEKGNVSFALPSLSPSPLDSMTQLNDNVIISEVIKDHFKPFGLDPPKCLREGYIMNFPMSNLEQELRRIYFMVDTVMKNINITYWPADGTLLGIIRHGRISTDRDLDFHILTTWRNCLPLLLSLEKEFKKVTLLTRFTISVGGKRHKPYRGVAMYAMVRVKSKFGSINTGADFTCVHHQQNGLHTVFNHFGKLVQIPNNTFPLIPCRAYDMNVLCPGDGEAMLKVFKPRYDGCMLFPHCFGNPEKSHKLCLTPHPPVPILNFINATLSLQRCGYANLVEHFRNEPLCKHLLELEKPNSVCCDAAKCKLLRGNTFCFLQQFKG